ncbi:unnamed protein product [Rotaria sordida]|uniref:MULE transposase domain-containing protein n=1 Tax=Rotaria sordida TaxID=392033 RepID=A0A819GT17_9BILA|nr:unnamed protein product [Rotaria sordida]
MFKMYQDHICQAPDPNEIEKALFNYEIKKKAEQCHDLPRLIVHEARLKLSSDAAITIPQCTAFQRRIQRIRQDEDIPTQPKTFADIVIPLNFQNTVTNQKFVLYDNNDHNRRLLIFASKEQLDFLNECESWHCDGTFAVTPKLFEPMYSIHGSIQTYEELFTIVKQHVERKPKYISIDFKKAAENAFGVIYPQCDIFGCFFHFKQCIWREICELHLKKEFLENDISRRTMKNLAALVFIPPQNVIEKFVQLKKSASDVLDGKMTFA